MEVFGFCVGVLSDSEIAVARARIAAGNRATAARIEPRRGEIGRFSEEKSVGGGAIEGGAARE